MLNESLKALWQDEQRLNRAWCIAAVKEDWTEAARIRASYNTMFRELVGLCRRLDIIE